MKKYGISLGERTFDIYLARGEMPKLYDLLIVRWNHLKLADNWVARQLTVCILGFYLVLSLMPKEPQPVRCPPW